MATMTFYHNPQCAKSREALALLESHGVDVQVRRYLDDPLSLDELRSLASRLDDALESLVRTKDTEWKALKLTSPSDAQRLEAIARYPRLMQRPLLDRGDRAVIGHPPEAVLVLCAPA